MSEATANYVTVATCTGYMLFLIVFCRPRWSGPGYAWISIAGALCRVRNHADLPGTALQRSLGQRPDARRRFAKLRGPL